MDLKAHVQLKFEASEWHALYELAQKYKTDVGSLLHIGAVAILEADRRGRFETVAANPALLDPFGPKGGRDS